MHRFCYDVLLQWQNSQKRKPLIIRGARQVGKSTLIKLFGQKNFEHLIEINFENEPESEQLFVHYQPQEVVRLLEVKYGKSFALEKTLLFLDEIQAAPTVIAKLRYFYETIPQLAIIAAGSLIEFALAKHSFSVPVGRIEYGYLGPMSFEEFLLAAKQDKLLSFLQQYDFATDFPELIHQQCMRLLQTYLVIGGMPEVIAGYCENASLAEGERTKRAILSTYQDDFTKYSERIYPSRLRKLFQRIPYLVGQKFKYVNVDRDERSKDLAESLNQLCMAKVAHKIFHTSANGIPLGAEYNEKIFKVLFLDVGLVVTQTGLSALDFVNQEQFMLINAGGIAEQFIGQHLLYAKSFHEEPELYYWQREKAQSAAEVDYLLNVGQVIIPVEVKAGKTGTLKSIQSFLAEKDRDFAVRFNSDRPSLVDTAVHLPNQKKKTFRLLSLPLYLVGQAHRFVKMVR